MTDVFRNNLFEVPALSKKKLFHFGKINQIWTLKDSLKIMEALSKGSILEHVACEHNIQARLYRGDGLGRVYELLEDNCVTRWLSTLCHDTYNDQEL